MRPLFEFNDAFVAAATYGDSDADLYALFEEAFGEVEETIVEELDRRNVGDVRTGWDEEGLYIDLDESQTLDEFGAPGHLIKPKVRPALVAATHRAQMRAEKVLDV